MTTLLRRLAEEDASDGPPTSARWARPSEADRQRAARVLAAQHMHVGRALNRLKRGLDDALPAGVSERGARRLRALFAGLSLLTAAYAFGFQPLGLMDVSAVSPFSQIRQHGGSNHLLLPTSLLQRWGGSGGGAFGGGVVRVTACTSAHINALYPANCTEELPARARTLLRSGGHLGQQWNPTVRVMLGAEIRQGLPRWQPGEPFAPFTVPGRELTRLLAEARDAGDAFSLRYEVLPGVHGDEAWRQRAPPARLVHLEEDGRGGRRCRAREGGRQFWGPCEPDELALRPPPSGLLAKLLVSFPYPIVHGLRELPCLD